MERTVIMRTDTGVLTDPFSYGNRWGNLLFVGGQSPSFDAKDFAAQARSVLEKIGVVLKLAGTDYQHVLRTGIYLANPSDFGAMNRVYREFFPQDFPTRTTLISRFVADRILITMDCVAGIPD